MRAWTRARSVAEGLKGEVFALLGGGSAYLEDDRERVLAARTQAILADAGDLVGLVAGIEGDGRPPPTVASIDDYLAARIDDQVDRYYRPKAALYARRLRRLQQAEAGLGGAAVVLAVLAGTGGVTAAGGWIAVVTTIGASVAAHAGAARYDHQVVEFERTATQLSHLRAQWHAGHLDAAALVDAAEAVISVENQAWMARLGDRDEGAADGEAG